jgi:UDP-N-acetylmuramoyl-tripeptide--D-alanyl-D-alanine ligase
MKWFYDSLRQFFYCGILLYLRNLAHFKTTYIKPQIIGVTGSVGKSSFIYLLDLVLQPDFRVRTTFKGNSETGLPLEILGLRDVLDNYGIFSWLIILFLAPIYALFPGKKYDVLIAEMGVDSPNPPKNMEYLLTIINPDIGVILNVHPAHTEQFGKALPLKDRDNKEQLLELIANEKGKIVTLLDQEKTAIVNIDNGQLRELLPKIKAKTITFGENKKADLRFTGYTVDIKNGTTFIYLTGENELKIKIATQILFREYGFIILAVLAAAQAMGVSFESAKMRIESGFLLPPGRFSLISGKKETTILDSSYNSSPVALSAALEFFQSIGNFRKRVLILGDMRELGELAPKEHKQMAKLIKDAAEEVILVGPLMHKYAAPELIKLGVPASDISTFSTSQGVGKFLATTHLKGGEIILVKGSQNTIFLEQVVYDLMQDQEDAPKLLCRQSKSWEKIRTNFFAKNPNQQLPIG